jgi:hypothetical protein
VVDKVTEMRNVNTGDLRKSITYRTWVVFGRRVLLRVGTNLKYAIYVHEGTKPHYPPLAPILRWVRQKNPRIRRNRKELKRRARAVVMKIGRYGTPANPFLDEVFYEEFNRIRVNWNRGIAEIVASLNGDLSKA